MFNLIKKYKSWNKFERKYFWISLLITSSTGGYSVNLLANPLYTPPIALKLGVITSMIALAAYLNHILFKSLEEQEMHWKGLIIDPLTNKEIAIQ